MNYIPDKILYPEVQALPTALKLPQRMPSPNKYPDMATVPTPSPLVYSNAALQNQRQQRLLQEMQAAQEPDYKSLTGVWDYNDPYAINSLADALFNVEGWRKRYGKFGEFFSDPHNPLPYIFGVPILATTALLDVAIVQPTANLVTGNFQAFGINLLTNFSEDVDILANPVKALITPLVNKKRADGEEVSPAEKLSAGERVATAFGFSKHGRTNFDYDTGNFALDLVMEIISDPITIISMGSSLGAKAAAAILKSISGKTVASIVPKATALLADLGVEAAEKTSKLTAKALIQETLELSKKGVAISKNIKLASASGLKSLKPHADILETALKETGSQLVDDSVKIAVKNLKTEMKNILASAADISPRARNAFNKLAKSVDSFTLSANRTAGDLLKTYLPKHRPTGVELRKLFNAPDTIKKLKNIDWASDVIEIGNKIPLDTYMREAAHAMNENALFSVARSFDALAEGAQKLDSAILKIALLGNPITASVYAGAKLGLIKHGSKSFTNLALKKLIGVEEFYRDKAVSTVASDFRSYMATQKANVKRITDYTRGDWDGVIGTGWEKQIARSTYNKNIDWLKGFGRTEDYGKHRPKNMMNEPKLLAELLQKNSSDIYPHGMTEKAVISKYFESLEELRQLATAGEFIEYNPLTPVLERLTINRQGEIQQAAFIRDLAESTGDTYIKTVRSVDASIAHKTVQSVIKDINDFLNIDIARFRGSVGLRKSKDIFTEAAKEANMVSEKTLADCFDSLVSAGTIFEKINEAEKVLAELKSKKKLDAFQIGKAELELIELYKQGKDQYTNFLRNLKALLRKNGKVPPNRKKSAMYKLYKKLQKHDIDSFAFGNQALINDGYKKLIQIKLNNQTITKKILGSPEMQALIDAFRPDGIGYKALDAREQEYLKALESMSSDAGEKSVTAINKQFSKFLDTKDTISRSIESIDNYVMHLQEVEQLVNAGELPKAVAETYLDTLHGTEYRLAEEAISNFEGFFYSFKHDMDTQLYTKAYTESLSLDHFAQKNYLKDPDKYRRFIQEAHTAQSDAELCALLFNDEILPKLTAVKAVEEPVTTVAEGNHLKLEKGVTKVVESDTSSGKRKVTLLFDGENTIVTTEDFDFSNPSWYKYKDKTFVFWDLETTGLNPRLDQVYEFGWYAGEGKKGGMAHSNFNIDELSPAVRNTILARPPLPKNKLTEVDILINMYRQFSALAKENPNGLVFVGHNTQNFDIHFRQRFVRQLEALFDMRARNPKMAAKIDEQINELVIAMDWFTDNVVNGFRLDTLSQLKELNGIPNTGAYSDKLYNILQSYTMRQAVAKSDLVLNLSEDFLEAIRQLPDFNMKQFDDFLEGVAKVFDDVADENKTWAVKHGLDTFRSDQNLIVGDLYKPSKNLLHKVGNKYDPDKIAELVKRRQIYIENPDELLELRTDRWYYKGEALPETVGTSEDALRYLKSQGQVYAPKWLALNQTQQLSMMPIIKEGKVSLESLDGYTLAFSYYADPDLILNYLKLPDGLTYPQVRQLTSFAKKIDMRVNRIQDTYYFNKYAKEITVAYKTLVTAIEKESSIPILKEIFSLDIPVYKQFAILNALLHSDKWLGLSEGTFDGIIKKIPRRAKLVILKPNETVYKKSFFYEVFDTYDEGLRGIYNESYKSKATLLDSIYAEEKRSGAVHARSLTTAVKESRNTTANVLHTLSPSLDKHKVYSAVLQRHSAVGTAQMKLHDIYLAVYNELSDGREIQVFHSLEKQLGNNLEDLIFAEVMQLNPTQLYAYAAQKGGFLVLPVGQYLKDPSYHNFDLRDTCKIFLKRYHQYQDVNIGVQKLDDNLIVYVKDYAIKAKQETLPEKIFLKDINYEKAFDAAFGIDDNTLEMFDDVNMITNPYTRAETIGLIKNSDVRKPKYSAEFIALHYDDIQALKIRHLEHYNELKQLTTEWSEQYSGIQGGYGRVMDDFTFKSVFEKLPEDIKNAILAGRHIDEVYQDRSVFDFVTFGRAQYRKGLEPFATSSILSQYSQTYRNMCYNLSAATQYAAFYYQNSPMLLDYVFKGHNNSEILSMLQQSSDQYSVSYMGFSENGLPKAIELPMNTVDDVEKAIEMNAAVLPNQTSSKVIQTVNSARWANSKLKIFHKMTYYMKMSMLILNPGFIFRNMIDSTLKNYGVAKDSTSMTESYIDAMNLYPKYSETVDMLFAINPESPFNPDTLKIIFADTQAPLDEQTFLLIHNFIESGPSAGSIPKIEEFYLNKTLYKNGETKRSAVQRFYETAMMPTKEFEQITRLSQYIELIKKGMSNTEAYSVITKTHFDYSAKTASQRLIELVIPFYSFQIKNFEFWLDMLSTNPILMTNLVNYLNVTWNFDEIDFDKIERYQSRLNHIWQANLQLNKKGLTLKINPSFMDPLQILANPVDSMSGRVTPILKPLMDELQQNEPYNYESIAAGIAGALGATSSSPVASTVGAAVGAGTQLYNRYTSGIRHAARTGSALPIISPSIFGSVKDPTKYGRASYTNSRTWLDPEMRRPRRVDTYRKLYTDSGKNRFKIRMLPLDGQTLKYRIRDNYNRFR